VSLQPNRLIHNGSKDVGHEEACARVTDLFEERWLRLYVRRKLRGDPIYSVAFELLRDSDRPLIDLGCGVGLLPFYLRERNFRNPITGVDRDGRKIARAKSAARHRYRELVFAEQDVGHPIPARGDVTIFDLLHYLSPNDQVRLLERVRTRLGPGGRLIIRDCPDDGNARFWLTHLAERFAQSTSWNIKTPLHFPPRARILAPFDLGEFSRSVEPLWGRTPFNNHLFIFQRRPAATVPG
jgi:SAM-dependent methyltransferase